MFDTKLVNICPVLKNVCQRKKNDSITKSITTRGLFAAITGYVFTNFINCHFWDGESVMRFESV